jgi:peptide-methionine (S)-S-oxide reductase
MLSMNENNKITTDNIESKQATLGGGCFWCLEAVYQLVKGVIHVESGYTGGQTVNPDYDSVCSGRSGHAEVVRIHYDPQLITFKQLLEVFFVIHDPTTLNRQGNDVGTQYRSVIYYHDDDQKAQAAEMIHDLNQTDALNGAVVTELSELPTYYKAESYHQNYFVNHPDQGYCAFVVSPKVEKFRKNLPAFIR